MKKLDFNKQLKLFSRNFRAVAVFIPSDKVALVRNALPKKIFVSLDDPDDLAFAKSDPKGFLLKYSVKGAIIHQPYYVPVLFNYMLQILDDKNKDGFFILVCDKDYLQMDSIDQSLAGRVGILDTLDGSFDL